MFELYSQPLKSPFFFNLNSQHFTKLHFTPQFRLIAALTSGFLVTSRFCLQKTNLVSLSNLNNLEDNTQICLIKRAHSWEITIEWQADREISHKRSGCNICEEVKERNNWSQLDDLLLFRQVPRTAWTGCGRDERRRIFRRKVKFLLSILLWREFDFVVVFKRLSVESSGSSSRLPRQALCTRNNANYFNSRMLKANVP